MFANDLGATAILEPLSGEGLGNEAITITLENFGGAAQSNFRLGCHWPATYR